MEPVKAQSLFGTLQLLLMTASFALLIWIVQFHWNRRKLYKMVENIPGPKGYPIIGNALSFLGFSNKKIFEATMGYFTEYLGFFKLWLGPKLYIWISKPEDLEIVFNHQQCLTKDDSYKFLKEYVGEGLVTAPVNIWRRHRKMINPTFNQKILDSFVEVFNEQANICTEVLRKTLADEHFDIFEVMNVCSLDFVYETIMGTQLNAQRSTNEYGELVDKILSGMAIRTMNLFYHPDFIFKRTEYGTYLDESLPKLQNYAKEVIRNKQSLLEEKKEQLKRGEIVEDDKKWKSFLEHLLQLTDGDKSLTEEQLKDEVNTFMVAGSDTTATTLSFLLLNLGLHPEVQRKVYEEVIDVLGYDRDITPRDLPRLQYLERCIKESLRLFPSAPTIFRKPSVDIDLGHAVIPAHSTIGIGIYHTHRSPQNWKDPLKFNSDRFLPEEVAKRHPCSFVAFSGGPRNCIGMKYAETAIKTTIAILIRKFVIKTEYKSVEEVELKTHMLLRPVHGFKVSVEPRE